MSETSPMSRHWIFLPNLMLGPLSPSIAGSLCWLDLLASHVFTKKTLSKKDNSNSTADPKALCKSIIIVSNWSQVSTLDLNSLKFNSFDYLHLQSRDYRHCHWSSSAPPRPPGSPPPPLSWPETDLVWMTGSPYFPPSLAETAHWCHLKYKWIFYGYGRYFSTLEISMSALTRIRSGHELHLILRLVSEVEIITKVLYSFPQYYPISWACLFNAGSRASLICPFAPFGSRSTDQE